MPTVIDPFAAGSSTVGQFTSGLISQSQKEAAAQKLASTQATTQLGVAQTAAEAQKYGSSTALQGQLAGYSTQQSIADKQAQTSLAEANIAAGTASAGYASQQKIAETQAEASKYPSTLQQQRFETIYPYLTSALSGLSGTASGTTGTSGVGTQPTITASSVYTPEQIQQNVNTQRATAAQSAAGQIKQQQAKLAGIGFGASSPLSQALAGATQGQSLQSSQAAETSTRLEAAKANASQLLSAQQALETQYSNRQQEEISRRQIAAQQYSSLLGALAGMA